MFKIDYYDPELQMGSPDPSDPAVSDAKTGENHQLTLKHDDPSLLEG